jgi:hypothetical protein
MGTFRIEIQAVGNHGCQRAVKSFEKVEGCKQPGCVDCLAREFVEKLKASGAFFSETGDRNGIGYALLTHWPGGERTVTDNLLTGLRSGDF